MRAAQCAWPPPVLPIERVDENPIVHLSLLDRALLRKYSNPVPPDGLSTGDYRAKVQNKRDGSSAKDEEPQPSMENAFAKPTDGEARSTKVTEIPMVESACAGIDDSTSPFSIAVTEASVDEGPQSCTRKRRRFTKKRRRAMPKKWY